MHMQGSTAPAPASQVSSPVQPASPITQGPVVPDEDDCQPPIIFGGRKARLCTDRNGIQKPDEADSAFGDDSSSYSASLVSSVLNYRYENERRYHGYRHGSYMAPNDETEQSRLDLMHHLFRMMLDGALFVAPISKDVQRILDIGTGTGICKFYFPSRPEWGMRTSMRTGLLAFGRVPRTCFCQL
jgi:hypothetical protein